jgi:hypothetical protein
VVTARYLAEIGRIGDEPDMACIFYHLKWHERFLPVKISTEIVDIG